MFPLHANQISSFPSFVHPPPLPPPLHTLAFQNSSTELSETLNRAMVLNVAATFKCRGVFEFEQMAALLPALQQMTAGSHHKWSEKTLRYFPPVMRDVLAKRADTGSTVLQEWQPVRERERGGGEEGREGEREGRVWMVGMSTCVFCFLYHHA